MAVCGGLEEFSLLAVLDLVVAKQGWLDVEVGRGRARFGVRDGGVLTACDSSWMPPGTPLEQVVFDVLAQRHGQFRFELSPVPDSPAVLPSVLLRAVESLAIEWEQHTQIAANRESLVGLNPNAGRSELVLDRPRWRLMRHLVRGPRSV
ncbi:MAG: hypothetical protein JWL70_913, partial [Acidimicrobiia bacterium]|nr:hypothetical protein [Acidimicrobiia bacterium]